MFNDVEVSINTLQGAQSHERLWSGSASLQSQSLGMIHEQGLKLFFIFRGASHNRDKGQRWHLFDLSVGITLECRN